MFRYYVLAFSLGSDIRHLFKLNYSVRIYPTSNEKTKSSRSLLTLRHISLVPLGTEYGEMLWVTDDSTYTKVTSFRKDK